MSNPLFHDGWRDPGDDAHRMVYYVAWVLGFIGGITLVVYSIGLLVTHNTAQLDTGLDEPSSIPGLPILLGLLGLFTMIRTGIRLNREIRRARKNRLTADAFVAGGILAGFALIALGFERLPWAARQPEEVGSLIVLGVIVVVASFLTGITIVLLPKLNSIPRTFENATIESRYAIDERLMEIDDHPNPFEERCTPMVRLRTEEGKVLNLKAGVAAYDLATPGARGTARIAGPRLKSFSPSRTR